MIMMVYITDSFIEIIGSRQLFVLPILSFAHQDLIIIHHWHYLNFPTKPASNPHVLPYQALGILSETAVPSNSLFDGSNEHHCWLDKYHIFVN